MPALLLSPTFWKFAGGAILVLGLSLAIGFAVHHYNDLKAQAALVPGLQSANRALVAQSTRDDSRASKAAIELVANEAVRKQALADQDKFRALAGQIGTTLQGIAHNANATKEPMCLPSDAERQLFNAAITRYSNPDTGAGPGRTSGTVPTGPN